MKYYLHDTNSFGDEKITELFVEWGYEGLGLFYTALEKIAYQEQPIKTSVLKAQLKVGKRLEKCWNFMESLGILSSNNGETFNKQLLNNSEKYLSKKKKNRIRVANFREKQSKVMVTKPLANGYVTPPNIIKDKISKDKIIKDNILAKVPFASKEIPKVLNAFKEINPTISFSNKTQRKACEDLIKSFGFDKLITMIDWYKQNMRDQYCPVATTPLAFKNKIGDIKAFADKKKDNNITVI